MIELKLYFEGIHLVVDDGCKLRQTHTPIQKPYCARETHQSSLERDAKLGKHLLYLNWTVLEPLSARGLDVICPGCKRKYHFNSRDFKKARYRDEDSPYLKRVR